MKQHSIVCALICAILLFTSCAPKEDGGQPRIDAPSGGEIAQRAMGRWVEEKINFGAEYTLFGAPTQLSDGSLRLYAQKPATDGQPSDTAPPLHQFDSSDGGATWQETPCQLNDTVLREVHSLAVAPNGSVLLYGYAIDPATKAQAHVLLYAAPNAPPQPIVFDTSDPLLQNDANHPNPTGLQGAAYPPLYPGQPQLKDVGFLSDTLAYACTSPMRLGEAPSTLDITFLFEPSTAKLTAKVDSGTGYSQGLLYGKATNQNGLCFLFYNEAAEATLINTDKTGTVTRRTPGLNPVNATFLDADGNFYYCNETGIFRMASGGSLSELVMESTGFSFSAENKFLREGGLLYANDGSFFVAVGDTADSDLHDIYRYRFDKTLPTVTENSLALWSLKDNATLRAGIVAFHAQHPELSISYTVGLSADAQGLTEEDVLRTLNTQLLAGQGPDVLLLDGLNASAYQAKGLLLDLSTQVSADALVPFVKNAYYKPGETFVMPARFSVPVMCGPAEKIGALTSLDALQNAVLAHAPRPVMDCMNEAFYTNFPESKRYALGFYSTDQLVQFALQTSVPALVQGGAVDTTAVTQVLRFIQAVANHSNMGDYPPTFVPSGSVLTTEEAVTWHDGGQEFLIGNAVYGWDVIQTPAYLATTGQTDYATGKWRSIGFRVQPGLVTGAYLPSAMLAVSAASKQPALALAFVQTMLSETVQSEFYQDGISVLQSRLDTSIALTCKEARLTHYNVQTTPQSIFESLQTPVVVDSHVRQSVTIHAIALMAGEETLEQAVAGVQHELGLYLAELA